MNLSGVEDYFLKKSGYDLKYEPEEKIGVVTVSNFPLLGKLTALRFIEWVQANPGGVVSLPTGKTPEFFIKYFLHYIKTWNKKETAEELVKHRIDPSIKPDVSSLHFVQIDEFYPINPAQHNSFYYYVNKFYIDRFGFDREKALLINCKKIGIPEKTKLEDVWPEMWVDLTLRYRKPKSNIETLQKSVLEEVDQWCSEYEEKIRALGGIGFFLGGIGPDGHIAFNIRGSDHQCTTRLTPINYETQAAAATDLGGIEVSKKRHAITIGLSTITYNSNALAIIIAAGETKAKVVADAVQQEEHVKYPATALHKLNKSRFYVTRSAASLLTERKYLDLKRAKVIEWQSAEEIITDLAVRKKKAFKKLTGKDFESDRFASLIKTRTGGSCKDITNKASESFINKINTGAETLKGTRFLHTAPHHDDIMLGYLPYAIRHIRDASNTQFFAYMTSGFTAVTNNYALYMVENLKKFFSKKYFKELFNIDYFNPERGHFCNRDVWQYLDGVAAKNEEMKREGEARRFLRILINVYQEKAIEKISLKLDELSDYFKTQYPGKKDSKKIQVLKGMIREWEADCLWGYLGFDSGAIRHMRLGFYTGDIFTEEPTVSRDVAPIVSLLKECNPDVVTVALDPEGSGPDTHYKVMQAIAESLRQYEKLSGRSDIEVWGYRNVWYKFKPSEADIFVPVSLNMFSLMDSAFLNAFRSQKNASFPSYEHDGPFSSLARSIQVMQYSMIKTCLGREFFNDHPHPLIRATRGFVFLKKMTLDDFYHHARHLKESIEERRD